MNVLSTSSKATPPALEMARANLIAMLNATDKDVMDRYKAVIAESSGKVDAALAVAIADPAQAANVAKLKEFQGVWEQFKVTRDTEIVAAIYAGVLHG